MRYFRLFIWLLISIGFGSCHLGGNRQQHTDSPADTSSREASADTLSLPIEVRAKFVTIQDGLPSTVVPYMLQDEKGFMWFCTNNGLARYDGNQMKVYLQDSTYALSSDRRVKKITEDRDFKLMWIYTASETFYCLDLTTGLLKNFLPDSQSGTDKKMAAHFTKSQLVEKGLFYMWGPKDGGLIVDYRDGTFKTQRLNQKKMEAALSKLQDHKPADRLLIKKWKIPNGRVFTDNKGGKWIYNKTGILRKVMGDSLVTLKLLPDQATNYIDNERFHIVEDNRGLIWISTYGKGLFVFNHDLTQGQHFEATDKGESPIASNYLLRMIADRHDGVWVSSEYGGVSHIQVMDKGVDCIYPNGSDKLDFSNVVRMLKKQRDGSVMVGTRDGCLYHYSADMRQLLGKSHFDSNVYSIVEMPHGKVWIGTRGKGIYGIPNLNFTNKNVFCLEPDAHGRMWIGTFGDGLSLAIPRGNGYEVKTFFADSVGLNEVRCLALDSKGILWGGTSGGLLRIDPDKFVQDAHAYEVYRRNYEIHDMLVDGHDNLWLTVPGEGLVCAEQGGADASDRRSDGALAFHVLDASQGLINNMVQSVVNTPDGNLWVSTQQGVSCWNARKKSFDNYLFSRIPIGNAYNENAAVCLDDGRVLLGGNYGLTLITPSHLHHVKSQTNVVFTSHPYSDELDLSYEERSPRINFSTLDYSDVSNVKYTCWLEGYDKAWSLPSPTSWVSYHNLPSGNYRLHVKASYSDGIWGKESVLDIHVAPPFYLSVWAILLYLLVVVVVIIMVAKNIRDKNELKGKIRLEQELTRYKLVFFTNIAHEFRTPLTLIQGSLEKENRIMKANHWQPELEKTLRTMDKSVQRMLRLIDQLLEFRKMQAGKLKLSLQETDVVMFVKSIYRMFEDAAESKQIDYHFESQQPACPMYLDQRKIDKVVFNLLSNAFKYTPAHGRIGVSLGFDNNMLTLCVADSGVGIPEEKRSQLFSRFMQSRYTGESFGIGLHLTYELVKTHHGTITYRENQGGGSVFEVKIPMDKTVYAESDFLVEDNPILQTPVETAVSSEKAEKVGEEKTPVSVEPLNRKTILLVEDDNDVRDFLVSELENCFNLKVATDGQAGLAMAKEFDVDLIVSDVMMPAMNGFELTKRLKNNFETSHIPVILLTALSTDEKVLEGTESGADAYMTKPFSPQLLVARIFQLLDQRERLKQKFSRENQIVRSAMCVNEQDQLFVKRLDAVIYPRIGETDLSVDKVAGLLHMGRTIFYKKVRGVTGYTPNDYIRVIRMKKAVELLEKGDMNVSEIAYAVGFDNPYYFSKCFKTQYGVPPSQYVKQKEGVS